MLARLGPFLTDEEREFIGMSIHDAIFHLIVGCEYESISVHILEFLFRYAFASYYHKRELLGEKEIDDQDAAEKKLVWGAKKDVEFKSTMSKLGLKQSHLMFDNEVFKAGMTATDFQTQLSSFALLPRTQAEELIQHFLVIHAKHNAGEQSCDYSGDPSEKGTLSEWKLAPVEHNVSHTDSNMQICSSAHSANFLMLPDSPGSALTAAHSREDGQHPSVDASCKLPSNQSGQESQAYALVASLSIPGGAGLAR